MSDNKRTPQQPPLDEDCQRWLDAVLAKLPEPPQGK